jgi:carboxyl-terminal processing protease
MEIKQGKSSFKWVWITATVIFCALFTFALIPGAAAQGNTTSSSSQTRNYANTVQNVFDFILRNYIEEVDPQILFEGAMNGILNALDDPYSAFLTESDMNDMTHTTQGNFGGVGLHIIKPDPRMDGKPPYVEVAAPIEDTPGWRAGIKPGDFITVINDIPTETISMDDVLGMLRGTPGEQVKLVIKRGERMEFPVTVTRAIIEVPTVKYAMIDDIGYLRVTTFTPMTAARSREAINFFKENDYKGLILDLRYNYGGRLDSSVDIANLFLDGGLVVRTRSRIPSENRDFNARRSTYVPADIPVVVLINRASASASEIVAGALKDHGRAYLVGENTFGKGSVQQIFPLSTTGFRMTTARYFTPSDANIDKIGIPPDREVKFPEYTEEEADMLNKLINANRIPEFTAENPEANAAQIEAFAKTLENEFHLDLSLLKRLIRNELRRTEIAPVYDLDYDIQLQEAINIIKSGDYQELLRNAKSIKALQEEAEEELALAS